MGLKDLLAHIPFTRSRKQASRERVEELRADFRSHYHHFKLLLTSNKKALETMAEMEEALAGSMAFGMQFVRSRCTRVAADVFSMVKHMDALAPGKYGKLYDRFKDIQQQINPFLSSGARQAGTAAAAGADDAPLVLSLAGLDLGSAHLTGSKMAALGQAGSSLGLRIPDGFVVTAAAYRLFLEHTALQDEINRRIQSSETGRIDQVYQLSTTVQQLLINAEVPPELEQDLRDAYRELEERHGAGVAVAMRSSALGEDAAGTSFAGQYRSQLNVSGENLLEAYKEVVAGKYSVQAMKYRLNRGIRDEDVSMCVGCMPMIDAVAGGVVYTGNPVDATDDHLLVNSVWGLPKPVVDGSAPCDVFRVARGGRAPEVVERNVADKTLRFECRPDEGVCRMELAEEARTAPSLEDDQVVELARQALALEEHFGGTQDIEWALHPDGGFVILQCRPLVQMERAGKDEDGNGADAPKSLLLSGGVTASPGAAAGAVHVVRKDMDALRFPDGAVLVAEQSLPRWAALLNRAAAVVTEQGGVAGHLANVAREFGVPGLFGLAGATEALENGQEVTVDADAAQVHQGRVEALLARRRKPRVLMQGSPVYEALRKASELIVPLHLLDPDSPEFRPANCRSLHDITRYCHEKSVQEMFRFGTQHRFPERSAKQLYCDVAMQFWVIDLEDGLERRPDHPVEDRFVFLDEIVSVPMLAVWRGMHAVPWGGPPPVDAKGFMSVLMESTANPQLDPSMPSDYAARNYFMISRTFCSLQSRFGFHFLTVETLVGERRQENYASFQFKGGAANLDRRVLRARLVAELLEAHGFLAEVKQDAVFARLEGRDREYMEKRLELVGYLLVHTRQLDMVMTSGGLEHHRERMRQDLKSLLHKDLGGAACPTR